MSKNLLTQRVDGKICFLTLNRPDALNALNPDLMRQLAEALAELARNDDVGCVVLSGAGKGFCAGGDLKAISQAAQERASGTEQTARPPSSLERRVQWVRRSAEASRLLHEMPKPTIAMINGACAGAGLSLAAACDFRHAGRKAVFRSAFTTGGVSGDYGGSWLWTHILGTAKARQLFLIDAKRSADEALDFGLVDAVHDDSALEEEVAKLAHRLAALPGKGVAYAKANLNAALTEKFCESLDRESLAMMLSRDAMVREAKARSKAAALSEEAKVDEASHVDS